MPDLLVFLVCLIDALLLMILSIYLIICLSDLECDFLNTKQGCAQLNQWVIPDLALTAFIPVFLLLTWHWIVFLLTCPYAIYLIHRYLTLPPGSMGIYDPTEIRNRGRLVHFQREAFVKVGYHLVIFFVLLYCFIVALVFS